MADFFFYGTLCHVLLLEQVLGRPVAVETAVLDDHAVFWVAGGNFPIIVEAPGRPTHGIVARGLTEAEVARLDFYEGGFAYRTRDVSVRTQGAALRALVYFPDPGHWQPAEPWSLPDWVARWGAVTVEAAGAYMARMGHESAAEARRRYGATLDAAAARLRARDQAPTLVRRKAAAGDIEVSARREPYAAFFSLEEVDLRFRRFDGAMSPVVDRAVFRSGDAATVLPYDPRRDRVLLIEQFRVGPHLRGDGQPWMLEAIAGRIDPGESPEECVRREAVEEAGLMIGALHAVAGYYSSPGANTEYLYSYVGVADLGDGAGGLGGLEAEAEDIRAHVLTFDEMMALVASGEICNAPLLLSALWLARQREALRSDSPGA